MHSRSIPVNHCCSVRWKQSDRSGWLPLLLLFHYSHNLKRSMFRLYTVLAVQVSAPVFRLGLVSAPVFRLGLVSVQVFRLGLVSVQAFLSERVCFTSGVGVASGVGVTFGVSVGTGVGVTFAFVLAACFWISFIAFKIPLDE